MRSTSEIRTSTLPDRLRRLGNGVRRGLGYHGPDRDALLLILKSAIAATIAWVLADVVLQAPSATFAPFSALLMVQVTVSKSLDQSVRYAVAVSSGVALAGLLSPLLGPTIVTFSMLMLIALLIGRWRRLGNQGPQVAVAAMFAYSSFTQSGDGLSSMVQLLSIAGLVLLGCVVGVVTNLAIVPPLRYRSAETSIRTLSQALCDLLADVSRGLDEGMPDTDLADSWHRRANEMPSIIDQARDSIADAVETMRLNPRRLGLREVSFDGYRSIVNGIERANEQLRSITRGISYAAHQEATTEQEDFLVAYSSLLAVGDEAARALGELHSNEDLRSDEQLQDIVSRGRSAYENIVEHTQGKALDSKDSWAIYGALETDAHRLVEEFAQVRRELQQLLTPQTHQEPIPERGSAR